MNHEPISNETSERLGFIFEQVGDDLNTVRFDARPEGDPVVAFAFDILAFKLSSNSLSKNVFQKHKIPTLTVQLTREPEWRSLYPELKGPEMCVLHFGPNHDMGRFGYGILGEEYMSKYLRRSSQTSSSIYFTAQNDREYKWKPTGPLIECVDTHTRKWVARYDARYAPPQMQIKGDGVLICTELMVTWYLFMNAKKWKWNIKTAKEIRAA
ncbi:hypothetical protein Clacol_001243 [Clathrus columnatus]|uniref:Uncharacterized protein n=1 Tax=Clathrus columnatus TaxID=1419009 RepID=A0AAV5A570_9AGAM|nr:hypothetical protein Clacol_001243 [Clathrus columnatus]